VHQLSSLNLNTPTPTASNAEITAAITAYDTDVQTRGRAAVLSSLENSLMVHDWDKMRESMVYMRGMAKDQQ
jgi:hypothetical protein